jgi:hypothetical protein
MMTAPTYLINHGVDFSNTKVYVFSGRVAAEQAADTLDGSSVYLVEREEDVAMSGPALVAIYNALAKSKIGRFESRTIGIRRLLGVLPQVAQEFPQATNQTKENTKMSDVANVTETETSTKSARQPKIRDDQKIYVLAEKNPKRVGSKAYDYFEAYQDGMTVEEYLANGGDRGNLNWDSTHGIVRVE